MAETDPQRSEDAANRTFNVTPDQFSINDQGELIIDQQALVDAIQDNIKQGHKPLLEVSFPSFPIP